MGERCRGGDGARSKTVALGSLRASCRLLALPACSSGTPVPSSPVPSGAVTYSSRGGRPTLPYKMLDNGAARWAILGPWGVKQLTKADPQVTALSLSLLFCKMG